MNFSLLRINNVIIAIAITNEKVTQKKDNGTTNTKNATIAKIKIKQAKHLFF